jgi:anti-sigma factor RsiW
MTECPIDSQLDAYCDGEVAPDERARIERHLENCSACSARVDEIQAMSRAFAEATPPRLSQISLHRLHARLDVLVDRGFIRLARVLTGLAASILLFGTAWLVSHSTAPVPTAKSVDYSMIDLDEQPAQASEPTPADWIVAQLGR